MQIQIVILIVASILLIILLNREMKRRFTEESFLSIVNHTFRTPLTRIKWMADALKGDMPRKDELEIITNLDNSANRLLGLVDIIAGIRDIHNISSYDLKAVSIREILEEAIGKYRASINEKNISLHIPSMTNLPLLSIDTKKISFVVHVILENAVLYGKTGGNIAIYATMKGSNLLLIIEDDGIGLTRKERRNVFERFFRGDRAKKLNTDGMGLGLYASREIIRRHHGSIKVKSNGVDKGAAFFITLPTKR